MSYLVSDWKTDLERKLHGTTIDKIASPYELAHEAARNVLLQIDPAETKRITEISNALYDNVYRYVVPTDLKGNKILDIRPQANRAVSDNFDQVYSEEFDRYKTNNSFTIEHSDGVKYVRISKSLTAGVLLNECESATANGTWAASSGASNLTADSLYKITGSASLNFDLASTGYIENSTMTQVDLSEHDEISSIFVWVYMPTVVTNVILRWGNSSTVYWSKTVTTNFDSTSFQTGWNLLRFDWSTASETGTVDPTAIDYIRVTLTYTGTADTDYRVDSIYSRLPEINEMVYYSKYLFRNSSGTWIEKPTDDTDIVNLDTDSYNLFLYESCLLAAQELQGEDASFDVSYWERRRKEAWDMYRATYKSEVIKPQSRYYKQPRINRR